MLVGKKILTVKYMTWLLKCTTVTQKYFCSKMRPLPLFKTLQISLWRQIRNRPYCIFECLIGKKKGCKAPRLILQKKLIKKNIYCTTGNFRHCFYVKGLICWYHQPFPDYGTQWNVHTLYIVKFNISHQVLRHFQSRKLNKYKLFLVSTIFFCFNLNKTNEKWTSCKTCKI